MGVGRNGQRPLCLCFFLAGLDLEVLAFTELALERVSAHEPRSCTSSLRCFHSELFKLLGRFCMLKPRGSNSSAIMELGLLEPRMARFLGDLVP